MYKLDNGRSVLGQLFDDLFMFCAYGFIFVGSLVFILAILFDLARLF